MGSNNTPIMPDVDLIEWRGRHVTNSQRREAAKIVALHFGQDQPEEARLLLAVLGLAEVGQDGLMHISRDAEGLPWYDLASPDQRPE